MNSNLIDLKYKIESTLNSKRINQDSLNWFISLYLDELKRNSIKSDVISSYFINISNRLIVKNEESNFYCIIDSSNGLNYEYHITNEEKNFIIKDGYLESKRNGCNVIISKDRYNSIPKIFYRRETTVVNGTINEDITLNFSQIFMEHRIKNFLNLEKYQPDYIEGEEVYYHIELDKNSLEIKVEDILKIDLINEYYPLLADTSFEESDEASVIMINVDNTSDSNYDLRSLNVKILRTKKLYNALLHYYKNSLVNNDIDKNNIN